MTITMVDHHIDEVKLLICVNQSFYHDGLYNLSIVLSSIHDLNVARVDVVIFTDTCEPHDLAVLNKLLSKFRTAWLKLDVSCYPETRHDRRRLSWTHREFMKKAHAETNSPYSHYVLLEEGMLLTRRNLLYFLTFRQQLRYFGLIPSMLRYEYNEKEQDIYTVDQQGQQAFLNKARIRSRGMEFLNLDVPYSAMFILDRDLMDEYILSKSFDIDASANVVSWGESERAAMGLAWEGIPFGFQSRYVVPLQAGTEVPDVMCWVRHLPNNYTNDYRETPSLILGKTRMDEIFTPFDPRSKQPAYVSCLDLEDASDASISFVEEMYSSEFYQRPTPLLDCSSDFERQLHQLYGDVNRLYVSSCQSILVSIATAYFFGPVIYVDTGQDLAMLYETYRPNDRHFVVAPHPHEIIASCVKYGSLLEQCVIFIGSAGSFNYGHWLVDDLPRLKSVFLLRARFPNKKIRILLSLLGDAIDKARKDSIEFYLYSMKNYSIEFLDHKIPYKVCDLFYASPVSMHPIMKSPAALEWLRTNASSPAQTARTAKTGHRIFVTRRPPDSRTLLNHEEVAEFLLEYGFLTIDVNGLSFVEQLDIFRAADWIVGCMGAGMTNLVFANNPTIIMLAPEGWVEPFYWDLAAVLQDRYAACYGKPDDKNVPANASSYTIDVARLASLMERLGVSNRSVPAA